MASLIVVKYHGPTNRHGARLSVSCGDFAKWMIPYPHELDGLRAYESAARMYADSVMGWSDLPIAGGWIKGASAGFAPSPGNRTTAATRAAETDLINILHKILSAESRMGVNNPIAGLCDEAREILNKF